MKNIAYFPGLSALRFIAAFLVVMHHAETIRHKYGLFHLEEWALFRNGGVAVSFFFVLSGFLITYLLLREHLRTGTVQVGKFYVRRVLRIWPLYFLLVGIGLFLVPLALGILHISKPLPYPLGSALALYGLFLPFVVNAVYGHHLLEPLWSIGVEEQFYLLWAPLAKYLRPRLPLVFVVIILTKLVLLLSLIPSVGQEPSIAYKIIFMLQFEAMAIGGIAAWLVFHHGERLLRTWILTPIGQVLLLTTIVLWVWLVRDYFPVVVSIYGQYLLFAWLVVNTSVNPRTVLGFLNRPWLTRLGDVSYGIYMYHILIVFGVILVGKKWLLHASPLAGTLVWYGLISSLLLGITFISKRYFEDWFLKRKP